MLAIEEKNKHMHNATASGRLCTIIPAVPPHIVSSLSNHNNSIIEHGYWLLEGGK